ncbi:MAG: cobalamin biosynthesis protein CobG [Pseudomonadota bacterium]
MSAPSVKGWCPGAYHPMMSGDGLIVRVRPRLARLSAKQVLALCDTSMRYGNGVLELTNRANLQIRGIAENEFELVLSDLAAQGILDERPELESRRNIVLTPFYTSGDPSEKLARELSERLSELPELPAKFGFSVDLGPARILTSASADIRLENGPSGLILRADGADTGRFVTADDAIDQLIRLATWFARTRRANTRRMARHLREQDLPECWTGARPVAAVPAPEPGKTALGPLLGAAFGALPARALSDLVGSSGAVALRVTPWRLFLLEGGNAKDTAEFVTQTGDPLLAADACPGAPYCPQASVETRRAARLLAPFAPGGLHVSGCPKGCARKSPAALTLVGRSGKFDLVNSGCAGDEPAEHGLDLPTLLTRMEATDAL